MTDAVDTIAHLLAASGATPLSSERLARLVEARVHLGREVERLRGMAVLLEGLGLEIERQIATLNGKQ